jgi:hypothetical protein
LVPPHRGQAAQLNTLVIVILAGVVELIRRNVILEFVRHPLPVVEHDKVQIDPLWGRARRPSRARDLSPRDVSLSPTKEYTSVPLSPSLSFPLPPSPFPPPISPHLELQVDRSALCPAEPWHDLRGMGSSGFSSVTVRNNLGCLFGSRRTINGAQSFSVNGLKMCLGKEGRCHSRSAGGQGRDKGFGAEAAGRRVEQGNYFLWQATNVLQNLMTSLRIANARGD